MTKNFRQVGKEYLDNIGKVKCLICGDYFKYISNTHLRKHNLTNIEYKQNFPYTPTMSRETLEMMHNNGIKRKAFFIGIRTINPSFNKCWEKSKETLPIRQKLGLCKRTESSIAKQITTLKDKAKKGLWYNPSSTQEAKDKIRNSAKKRYKELINLKVDKNSGRFVKLNNGKNGIPPKPKDLDILPNFI